MGKRVEVSPSPAVPEHVTIAWLVRHVSIGGWMLIGTIAVGFFSTGLAIGRSWYPTEIQTIQPVPIVSKDELKARLDKLIDGYNSNTNRITTGIIDEEKGTSVGMTFERDAHQKAAERLKELLKQEHEQFQKAISTLETLSSR